MLTDYPIDKKKLGKSPVNTLDEKNYLSTSSFLFLFRSINIQDNKRILRHCDLYEYFSSSYGDDIKEFFLQFLSKEKEKLNFIFIESVEQVH